MELTSFQFNAKTQDVSAALEPFLTPLEATKSKNPKIRKNPRIEKSQKDHFCQYKNGFSSTLQKDKRKVSDGVLIRIIENDHKVDVGCCFAL